MTIKMQNACTTVEYGIINTQETNGALTLRTKIAVFKGCDSHIFDVRTQDLLSSSIF